MKWNKAKTLGLLLAAVFVYTPVNAASITSSDLPEDSNWYVHVNIDLIRNSEVGQEFMQDKLDEAIEEIEDELGWDLAAEIEGVTVFGGSLPVHKTHLDDGAVILHGLISEESQLLLLEAIEERGPEVSTTYVNGLALHTIEAEEDSIRIDEEIDVDVEWVEHETLYFSFGDTQTLITQSMELMQAFLDANGYLGGFENVDTGALLVLQADRALIQGGAVTTTEIGGEWDSSVLKNLDAVAVVVAENHGGLHVSAQLIANSDEVALSVRNIVEGIVALKALSVTDEPLGDILRNVRFENDGPVLHVDVPIDADQIKALKDL